MGRQTRFFMVGKDEVKFFEIIGEFGDLTVDDRANPINLNKVREFPVYTDERIDPPPITQFFVIPPELNVRKTENGFIDQISSDVIEFSRCSITDKNIVWEGRIWAEFRYYDENDQLVKKEKWFEQKFNKYSRWIKKNLRISIDKDSYIGEEAYRLYKEKGYRMMNSPNVEIKF